MKKTLFVAIHLLLYSFGSFAQSVDLRKERFNLSIRRFPNFPQDTTFKTFSVEYPQGNIVSNEFGVGFSGCENTNIPGFKRVSGIGHLIVKYTFIDARIVETNVREIRTDQKNINGQVIATNIEYVPTFKYALNAKADVFDYKGNLLRTEFCKITDKLVDAGPERFKEYLNAEKYLYNNRVSIYANVFTNEFNNFVGVVNNSLSNNFGWDIETPYAYILTVHGKHHPEFQTQEQLSSNFVSWTAGINAEQDLNVDQKAQAESFLTYYESLKTKYAADERHERKVRFEAFFNKGIIYLYFLNDFDKAINEGMGLIANEHDIHEGKWLIEEANRFKKLLSKSKRTSLRFPINLQNALAPSR